MPGRRITDGDAYLEVLSFVRRVLFVVGTIEEIELPLSLIDLRCPEAIDIPLQGVAAAIHLSAGIPVDEVVAHKGFEAVGQRGSVHIVTSVAGMEQVGVAELQRDWVRHGACLRLGLPCPIRARECQAQQCQRNQVLHIHCFAA